MRQGQHQKQITLVPRRDMRFARVSLRLCAGHDVVLGPGKPSLRALRSMV
jgi:hypothetical protein